MGSNTCIIRSSEHSFHVIMTMLISFHHRLIMSKEHVSSLSRMCNLWLSTGSFVSFEVKGDPYTLLEVTGSIFSTTPSQEDITRVYQNSNTSLDWNKLSSKDHFEQKLLTFKKANGQTVWTILSGYKNSCRNDDISTFIDEDISEFYRKRIIPNKKTYSYLAAARLLDLHKINKNISFDSKRELMKCFGISYEPINFKSILKPESAQYAHLFLNQTASAANVIVGDKEPVIISSVPSEKGGFFIFKNKPFMEAIRVIFDHFKGKFTGSKIGEMRQVIFDFETDTAFQNRTHSIFRSMDFTPPKKLPKAVEKSPNIKKMYQETLREIIKEDRGLFMRNFKRALKGENNSFTCRLETPYFYNWRLTFKGLERS